MSAVVKNKQDSVEKTEYYNLNYFFYFFTTWISTKTNVLKIFYIFQKWFMYMKTIKRISKWKEKGQILGTYFGSIDEIFCQKYTANNFYFYFQPSKVTDSTFRIVLWGWAGAQSWSICNPFDAKLGPSTKQKSASGISRSCG